LFIGKLNAMLKHIVLYALISLLSCTACSNQKAAVAEESKSGGEDVEEWFIDDGVAIIPTFRYDPETGDFISYEPPEIPESVLRILRENMKYENSQDPYYWIRRELSEEGLNSFRVIQAANAAIRTGNIELVQEIFKYYVNFANWTFVDIRAAAETGSLEMVKLLLDTGVVLGKTDDWFTDFSWYAAYCPNPDVILFLIEHGEDINKTRPYCGNSVNHAAEHGRAENLRVLLEAGASFETFNWDRVTALMLAGRSGNDECVRLLLEAGADIEAADNRGNTALMAAAESGNARSVRLLLKAGAGKHINAKNGWGSTALIEAAINGNGETVKTLIAAGADVNAGTWKGGYYGDTQWYLNSGGLTALMLASTADAVKALLAGGVDVNVKDSDGHNAIYYQCFFYRNAETIEALIKAGSYLYLDVNGGSVLLRLSRAGYSDWEQNDGIIAMLEKAGCVDDDPDWDPWDDPRSFRVDRH
jgi:ankyrin repeat protein